jgi:hypothetical protein
VASLSLATLLACAHGAAPTPQREIVRDDWMAVPAHGGGREVITRQQYVAERARRVRPKAPNREAIPPALLKASHRLQLSVGQVRTFLLVDDPVRRMSLNGPAASVFWTIPYLIDRMESGHFVEHKGADVHLVGVAPGRSELMLELFSGETRTFEIEVAAPSS